MVNSQTPACKAIRVIAFRGDRSRAFSSAFLRLLDDQKHGRGPGPSGVDCLLFAGHTGVSVDGGATVYGFGPDQGGATTWQMMDRLKNGDAFGGIVRDDTAAFAAAAARGLDVISFDVIVPEPQFQGFIRKLDAERKTAQYRYGFPNGDGDCNCTTWLERLGLPLLTGRMDEFVGLPGIVTYSTRRFGECR